MNYTTEWNTKINEKHNDETIPDGLFLVRNEIDELLFQVENLESNLAFIKDRLTNIKGLLENK